jgi:hypothetical protein
MRDALLGSIAEKRGVEKLAGWLVQYVAQSRFFFASLQDPKGKQHTRTQRLDAESHQPLAICYPTRHGQAMLVTYLTHFFGILGLHRSYSEKPNHRSAKQKPQLVSPIHGRSLL